MKKALSLKTQLLDICPHCGVLIARHMIYPDDKQCVYTQDKDWQRINNSLSIRKGNRDEKQN